MSFDPILATGLRLDVFAEDGVSAGPRDWRTGSQDPAGSKK